MNDLRMIGRGLATCIAILFLLSHGHAAMGLNIVGHYIAAGEVFPTPFGGSTQATAAPSGRVGGGALTEVFEAAASIWEAQILDEHTVNVYYGWADLPNGTLGNTNGFGLGDPQRVVWANIQLSNSTGFFVDPTPDENEEYCSYSESTADLGGGTVETSRSLGSPRGDAVGRLDLLTTILHELGHAIGMTGLIRYQTEVPDGDIDVLAPLPFAGSAIPVTGVVHLNLPGALMGPYGRAGVRRLPSDADVLAAAQSSLFTSVVMMPEPGTVCLLGLAAAGGLLRRGRQPLTAHRHHGACVNLGSRD